MKVLCGLLVGASSVLLLPIPLAHAQGRHCVQGGGDASLAPPFFAGTALGVSTVTVYYNVPSATQNYFDGSAIAGGAQAWNQACPGTAEEPPKIPTFATESSGNRPPVTSPNSPAYRSTIQVNYLPDVQAQELHHDGAVTLVTANWNGQTNTIDIFGRCPQNTSSGIPCSPGTGTTYILWNSDWGREVFAHELGHALGLGHDFEGACSGKGVMGFPIDKDAPRRGIPPTYCKAVNDINDHEAECNSAKPATGHRHSCEPLTPREQGLISPHEIRGEGLSFCARFPGACGGGGGGGGGLILCAYACVEVSDSSGSTKQCSWHCDRFGATGSGDDHGLGPRVGLSSPPRDSVLSGTVDLVGWAQDFAGLAAVLFSVDGLPAAVTNYQYGLPSALACTPPLGSWHPACNPRSGFSARLDTRGLTNGSHFLEIVGIDVNGWASDLSVPIEVSNSCSDTVGPTVGLTSPAAGTEVSGVLGVTVSAADASGIHHVQFLVDGVVQATDATAPFSWSWNTGEVANGQHTVRARARDTCENETLSASVSVTVNNATPNPPPRLWVDLPGASATVGGSAVEVLGWATDESGVPRDGLSFRLDGQPLTLNGPVTWFSRPGACAANPIGDPFCPAVGWQAFFNSAAWPNGSHLLEVTARDPGGAAATFPRSFSIANAPNLAPHLAVGWPAAGQTVSGTSVWIEGHAADDDGIASLTFTLDGAPIPTLGAIQWLSRPDVCSGLGSLDPACPYVGWRVAFDSTAHPDGTRTLRVTALDGQGGTIAVDRGFTIGNQPQGSTRNFQAIADTYIAEETPTANFATQKRLAARGVGSGHVRYSFLKFNVTNLSGPVTSTKLVLTEAFANEVDVLRVFKVFDTAWTESGLTWNNAPWSAQLLTEVYDLAPNQTHVIDVTGAVSGNGSVTIGLGSTVDELFMLSSREELTFAKRPELRVTYAP